MLVFAGQCAGERVAGRDDKLANEQPAEAKYRRASRRRYPKLDDIMKRAREAEKAKGGSAYAENDVCRGMWRRRGSRISGRR